MMMVIYRKSKQKTIYAPAIITKKCRSSGRTPAFGTQHKEKEWRKERNIEKVPNIVMFTMSLVSCVSTYFDILQQFASKHKPQTFSRVCLRLKRDVYRWKRNVSLLM
jgi:hypothetical protein